MCGVVGGGVGIGNTVRDVIATVDRIADGDVAADELFHITSLIGIDAGNRIAVIVHDVKVTDAGIVFALFGREPVVFVGGDFTVGLLVDTDELIPLTVLFAGFDAVVGVFDSLAVFISLEAIIVNTGTVKNHGAGSGFIDAKFGHNNVGFTATTGFNFGAFGDNLAKDRRFTDVGRKTSGSTKNKTIEFVGLFVTIGAGGEVFIEQEVLVGLGVVDGAELFLHDV